ADAGPGRALPLDAPRPGHAGGGPEPARGPAHGHQRGARVFLRVGAGRRGRRGGRRAGGAGHFPVEQDGTDRRQRFHGGGAGRLRLHAGRRRRRHAARRAGERGAALPAVVHPLLGAVHRAGGHPLDPAGRTPRARRAEESVTARAPLVALAVLLAAWPWLASRYFVFLASLILVNAIVALG